MKQFLSQTDAIQHAIQMTHTAATHVQHICQRVQRLSATPPVQINHQHIASLVDITQQETVNDCYSDARIAMGVIVAASACQVCDESVTSALSLYDAIMRASHSSAELYRKSYVFDIDTSEIESAYTAANADIKAVQTMQPQHDMCHVLDGLIQHMDVIMSWRRTFPTVGWDTAHSERDNLSTVQPDDWASDDAYHTESYYDYEKQHYLNAEDAHKRFTELCLLATDELVATLQSYQDPRIVAVCVAYDALLVAQSAYHEIVSIHETFMRATMRATEHQLSMRNPMHKALQTNEFLVTLLSVSVHHAADALAVACPIAQGAAHHACQAVSAITQYMESPAP